MIEHRKNLTAFGAMFGLSLALTLGAIVWLGPEGRVPVDIASADGAAKDTSVMGVAVAPLIVLVLWLMQIPMSWAMSAPLRAPPIPQEDFANNLRRYLQGVRFLVIGGSAAVILCQVFVIVRTAGIAAPLGFNREGFVRLAFFMFGMLFAYFGNASPKTPYAPNQNIDAARHFRAARFSGWVLVIGGFAVCALALSAPFDVLTTWVTSVIFTMMTLLVVRGLVDVRAFRR